MAGTSVSIPEHRLVLYAKIGPGVHPCHWCGCAVEWLPVGAHRFLGSLVVDHLDNNGRNNDPDNLVPSCNACNTRRGQSEAGILVRDDEHFIVKNGRRNRAAPRDCLICGREFLVMTGDRRRFAEAKCCSVQCGVVLRERNRRAAKHL